MMGIGELSGHEPQNMDPLVVSLQTVCLMSCNTALGEYINVQVLTPEMNSKLFAFLLPERHMDFYIILWRLSSRAKLDHCWMGRFQSTLSFVMSKPRTHLSVHCPHTHLSVHCLNTHPSTHSSIHLSPHILIPTVYLALFTCLELQ